MKGINAKFGGRAEGGQSPEEERGWVGESHVEGNMKRNLRGKTETEETS